MHERTERDWAELLALQLDALEDVIRCELAPLAKHRGTLFRGERKQLRLLDLTDALEAVEPARAALARCPAGAELAMKVLTIVLNRLRPAVELADLHYRGALKGAAAPKPKRRRRTARRDATLLAKAAKLNPKLTPLAKAKRLARNSTLKSRTIHRILTRK